MSNSTQLHPRHEAWLLALFATLVGYTLPVGFAMFFAISYDMPFLFYIVPITIPAAFGLTVIRRVFVNAPFMDRYDLILFSFFMMPLALGWAILTGVFFTFLFLVFPLSVFGVSDLAYGLCIPVTFYVAGAVYYKIISSRFRNIIVLVKEYSFYTGGSGALMTIPILVLLGLLLDRMSGHLFLQHATILILSSTAVGVYQLVCADGMVSVNLNQPTLFGQIKHWFLGRWKRIKS